jgi:hypothetical protein
MVTEQELIRKIRSELEKIEDSEPGPWDYRRGNLHCRKRWDTVCGIIVQHKCKYRRDHGGGFHVCGCGAVKQQMTRKAIRSKAALKL